MDPKRWKRLEEIFAAASEVTGPQWAALLDRLSGGETSLRAAVEPLLRSESSATTLIASAVQRAVRETQPARPSRAVADLPENLPALAGDLDAIVFTTLALYRGG